MGYWMLWDKGCYEMLGVMISWILWDTGCYGILGIMGYGCYEIHVMGYWVLWDTGCYGVLGVLGYWVSWEPQPRLTAFKELHALSRNVKIISKVYKYKLCTK
jgi:hypothetical protein